MIMCLFLPKTHKSTGVVIIIIIIAALQLCAVSVPGIVHAGSHFG